MAPHDPVNSLLSLGLARIPQAFLSPTLNLAESLLDVKIPSLLLGSSQGRPSPFLKTTAFPTTLSHPLLARSCIGFLQPIFLIVDSPQHSLSSTYTCAPDRVLYRHCPLHYWVYQSPQGPLEQRPQRAAPHREKVIPPKIMILS